MPPILIAHQAAVAAFVRARVRQAVGTAAVAVPIAIAIVAFDYRLVLFAVIAVAPALLALAALVDARATGRGLQIRVEARPDGLSLYTARERVSLAYAEITVVRALPDAVIITRAIGRFRGRSWTIPADRASAAPLVQELERQGVRVIHERGGVAWIAEVLVGVLLWRALRLLAMGLLVGGLANLVGRLFGWGSLALGAGLLAGAFTAMVAAVILRSLLGSLPRSPHGEDP